MLLDGQGGSNWGGQGYGRPKGRGQRNAAGRDDKVHDSLIEERIQRERPCRTLFIRNIKASLIDISIAGPANRLDYLQYETSSDEVRHIFEEYGEIKTFFDLIANRGMVFVTFVS